MGAGPKISDVPRPRQGKAEVRLHPRPLWPALSRAVQPDRVQSGLEHDPEMGHKWRPGPQAPAKRLHRCTALDPHTRVTNTGDHPRPKSPKTGRPAERCEGWAQHRPSSSGVVPGLGRCEGAGAPPTVSRHLRPGRSGKWPAQRPVGVVGGDSDPPLAPGASPRLRAHGKQRPEASVGPPRTLQALRPGSRGRKEARGGRSEGYSCRNTWAPLRAAA